MRGIAAGAAILRLFGGLWFIVAMVFWHASHWGIPVTSAATLVLLVVCILRLAASAKLPDSHDPASSVKGERARILSGIIWHRRGTDCAEFGIVGGLGAWAI